MMEVIPAIDLRGGRCVRLHQGDFTQETVFGDDPVAWAEHWAEQGARRLHLVDLDGARTGHPVNFETVLAILERVRIPCQLGGGVRDEDVVASWLGAGLERVIVGTRALTHPEWFRGLATQYPGRLVLGVDAREGMVATQGWLDQSEVSALDLIASYADLPLGGIVYTDIARDGTLAGPNLDAIAHLARTSPIPVIASGGVGSLEDIARLAALRVSACIVGRALYDKRFLYRDAVSRAGSDPAIPTSTQA